MKRMIGVLVMMAVLTLGAAQVCAAEGRIAFVDLQKALHVSDAGQKAKQVIGAKFQEYEGKMGAQQEELKRLKDELEKQGMLLSEEKRAEKEREYQQKLKDFQRFTKDAQEELQQQDAEHSRRIIGALVDIVKEIAVAEGYSMVLEQTESSIVYASREIDLTDKVIEKANSRAEKAK